jgi:hypothetical protein
MSFEIINFFLIISVLLIAILGFYIFCFLKPEHRPKADTKEIHDKAIKVKNEVGLNMSRRLYDSFAQTI